MLTPSPVAPHQAQAELVTQPLYDSDTIATGATSITWFDGTNTNNLLLSNMEQAGVLSHPKFFRVGGLRIVVVPATDSTTQVAVATVTADVTNILYSFYFVFTIGALKPYLTCPFFFIPGGLGPVLRSGNTTAYSISNGQEMHHNFLRLKHHISIPPLQSFRAAGTAPTGPTLTTTTRVYVFLDGEFGREVI